MVDLGATMGRFNSGSVTEPAGPGPGIAMAGAGRGTLVGAGLDAAAGVGMAETGAADDGGSTLLGTNWVVAGVGTAGAG